MHFLKLCFALNVAERLFSVAVKQDGWEAAAQLPLLFPLLPGVSRIRGVQSPQIRSKSSWTSEAPGWFCGVQNRLVFRDHFPPGFLGGIIFQTQGVLTCSRRCSLVPLDTGPDVCGSWGGDRSVLALLGALLLFCSSERGKIHQSCLISCFKHSYFNVHLHMKLNHVTARVGKFWLKPISFDLHMLWIP